MASRWEIAEAVRKSAFGWDIDQTELSAMEIISNHTIPSVQIHSYPACLNAKVSKSIKSHNQKSHKSKLVKSSKVSQKFQNFNTITREEKEGRVIMDSPRPSLP
jgi:hypothetical protein